MRRTVWLIVPLTLAGCTSVRELQRSAEQVAGSGTARTVSTVLGSGDPAKAASRVTQQHLDSWKRDPRAALRDLEAVKREYDQLSGLLARHVKKVWGDQEVKLPSRTTYVKYGPRYESRTEVDFETGEITVETLDEADPDGTLRRETATALGTPADPSAVDVFSDRAVTPREGEEPFLAGAVVDEGSREVRTRRQADAYAERVVRTRKETRRVRVDGVERQASYVKVPLAPNFQDKLAEKYRPLVARYAEQYRIDPTLVLAVIKTESNFNPYAVSSAPAYGLMQLVPTSGGRDAYRRATGTDRVPSKEFLFDAEHNIELGTAYLNVLHYDQLRTITDDASREYCVISAYNTGTRNVLRSFARAQDAALVSINGMSPPRVFEHLRTNLPYQETREYLQRVTSHKQRFRAAAPAPAAAGSTESASRTPPAPDS